MKSSFKILSGVASLLLIISTLCSCSLTEGVFSSGKTGEYEEKISASTRKPNYTSTEGPQSGEDPEDEWISHLPSDPVVLEEGESLLLSREYALSCAGSGGIKKTRMRISLIENNRESLCRTALVDLLSDEGKITDEIRLPGQSLVLVRNIDDTDRIALYSVCADKNSGTKARMYVCGLCISDVDENGEKIDALRFKTLIGAEKSAAFSNAAEERESGEALKSFSSEADRILDDFVGADLLLGVSSEGCSLMRKGESIFTKERADKLSALSVDDLKKLAEKD